MSIYKNLTMSLIALNLLFSVSQGDVFAQENTSLQIEEIIVTAQKREQSAQDVPIAITAMSEELLSSTIRDISDITGYAPNVVIGSEGRRPGGTDIQIRGISAAATTDNSYDSPIAINVDGIYLGTSAGSLLDNFDMERIEILRGPQGTLFGKNTVGGVVNVIRTRPTGEFGAKVQMVIGEDGLNEQRLVLNLPKAGNISTKVFATSMKDDGWLPNVTSGKKIPRKNYSNYGLAFLWEPSDQFNALLTVEQIMDKSQLDVWHTNYNMAAGVFEKPTDPREKAIHLASLTCTVFGACRTSTDIPGNAELDTEHDAENDIKAYTLNLSYDLNENITLKAISSIREQDEYRIYDYDGSAAPMITIERWNEYEQTSHEFRFEGQWENSSLIAGVYLWESEFTQDWVTGGQFWKTLFGGLVGTKEGWATCQGTNGFDNPFFPINCDRSIEGGFDGPITQILYETQETESTAAFFQYERNVTEKLALTVGARWTEEEKHFIAGQAYLSSVAAQRNRQFIGYADLNNTWDETSLKFGATYEIDEDRMVYASFSEGFHSGGFFGVNQNIRDFERDQYDPEYATSIEVGFKSMMLDNRLRFNVAAFRNEFEDKQESFVKIDPDTKTVASVFDNAAEVLYEGIEVEVLYAATRDLRLFLNAGWLDANYEEFTTDITPTDGVVNVVDASFLEPRNAPEYTLGLGFNFTKQIGAGEMELFAKYTKIADFQTDVLNLNAGRTASGNSEDLSATIGYYFGDYSVSLYGKNLTDEQVEWPVLLGGSPTSGVLFAAGTITRGRHLGIEFTAEF
jgi:iron complex outermembrane receptor protein